MWDKDNVCVWLSEQDYNKIEKALVNPLYRNKIEYFTDKSESLGVFAALLGFYDGRATSFASLFIASIFGTVTLAAIIRNFNGGPLWYVVSAFPYFGFITMGYFTWLRFCYYANIADKIEGICIRLYNYSKLKDIFVYESPSGGGLGEVDFLYFIKRKHFDQKHHWTKRILSSQYFMFIAAMLIVCLSMVAYWVPLVWIYNNFYYPLLQADLVVTQVIIVWMLENYCTLLPAVLAMTEFILVFCLLERTKK